MRWRGDDFVIAPRELDGRLGGGIRHERRTLGAAAQRAQRFLLGGGHGGCWDHIYRLVIYGTPYNTACRIYAYYTRIIRARRIIRV